MKKKKEKTGKKAFIPVSREEHKHGNTLQNKQIRTGLGELHYCTVVIALRVSAEFLRAVRDTNCELLIAI